MTVSDYIEAMPKVDLSVQFHGAMKAGTVAMIAEQNDIIDQIKHYHEWLALVRDPDYQRVDEIAKMEASWLQQTDDLKYLVYELATALFRQNVRYAEISIDPTLYGTLSLQPDDFMTLINDGRDRAERAWGIRIAWIITMPREEPRRAEELVRWATGPAASKSGIVGIGLGGHESAMPIGQFERSFKLAEKREVARMVRAGDEQGVEGVTAAIDSVAASRIVDGFGLAEAPEMLAKLRENDISLCVNVTRAVKQGWVEEAAAYPMRALYDSGVQLVLGSDMPALYETSLVQEYQQVVESELLTLDELEEVALNAVRASALDDEAKAAMVASFTEDYAKLRTLYIEEEA
ncbi:MAG: hypothetical protein IH587_08435 [Anaerolineae bacterium]|nr:hypothetical protein [Anaerolineae bacterium]